MLHVYAYRFYKKIWRNCHLVFTRMAVWFKFKFNNVKVGKGMKSFGVPVVDVWVGSEFSIGEDFRMNNGKHYNTIGRQYPCLFIVQRNGAMKIGNNVGMSSTAIVCYKGVTIGDNVTIGGNVVIYDSDFHSLDKEQRRNTADDLRFIRCAEVT